MYYNSIYAKIGHPLRKSRLGPPKNMAGDQKSSEGRRGSEIQVSTLKI